MIASGSFSAEREETNQDRLSDIFSKFDVETREGEDSFQALFNNHGNMDDHSPSLDLPWCGFRLYLVLTHRES